MAVLRTDYQDDILSDVNEKRKFQRIVNDDGSFSFEDVTVYSQEGDGFGAKELNEIGEAVNENTRKSIDFSAASALHSQIYTETGSFTLNDNIQNYKLIEVIMQYGATNWITTRLFRPSTLSQFPNIMDSVKTSMLECYYNMYISGTSVNIGAISNNTRILIRGIK